MPEHVGLLSAPLPNRLPELFGKTLEEKTQSTGTRLACLGLVPACTHFFLCPQLIFRLSPSAKVGLIQTWSETLMHGLYWKRSCHTPRHLHQNQGTSIIVLMSCTLQTSPSCVFVGWSEDQVLLQRDFLWRPYIKRLCFLVGFSFVFQLPLLSLQLNTSDECFPGRDPSMLKLQVNKVPLYVGCRKGLALSWHTECTQFSGSHNNHVLGCSGILTQGQARSDSIPLNQEYIIQAKRIW